jgi:hypothetical protein
MKKSSTAFRMHDVILGYRVKVLEYAAKGMSDSLIAFEEIRANAHQHERITKVNSTEVM